MQTLTHPAYANKSSISSPPARKATSKLLAVIALVAVSASAQADSYYTFNFTDGTDIGNGTLTVNASDLATAGTLDVTGGAYVGAYNLFLGGPSITNGPFYVATGGFDYFNNLVYPAGNPLLDTGGLDFLGSSGGVATGFQIWGNAANNYSLAVNNATGNVYYNGGGAAFTLTTVATPIPAALWMAGSALAGAFGFMRRKVA